VQALTDLVPGHGRGSTWTGWRHQGKDRPDGIAPV
jgi:hypothetical protein